MNSKKSSIFDRFWKGLGKVLEGFGKVLVAFSEAFLCQDPRAVSRSPAERPNNYQYTNGLPSYIWQ